MTKQRGQDMRGQRNTRYTASRKARAAHASELSPAPFGGVLVPLLLALVVASSLAVVESSHRARQLFSEYQDLQRQAGELDEEWGRLLLEQSTWAAPDRVQSLSEGRLKMSPPKMSEIVIVRPHD